MLLGRNMLGVIMGVIGAGVKSSNPSTCNRVLLCCVSVITVSVCVVECSVNVTPNVVTVVVQL